MSHHIPAVSWDQARELLHAAGTQAAPDTKAEALPLLATIDHYLSEDVHAMMPVPHYSSSAMDGYAVAGNPPWRLVRPPTRRILEPIFTVSPCRLARARPPRF